MGVVIRDVMLDISEDDDLSLALDFGKPVRLLWIYVPDIDSADVDIHASISVEENPASDTFKLFKEDLMGGAGTGDEIVNLSLEDDIAGFRYFKIGTSQSQSADRVFRVGATYC